MNHTGIISVPDPAASDAWLDNQGFHRSQRQMREPNMRVSVSGSLCDASFQGKSFTVSGVWDLDLLRPKLEKRWTQDQQYLRQYSGPQARENNLAAPDVIQLLESRLSAPFMERDCLHFARWTNMSPTTIRFEACGYKSRRLIFLEHFEFWDGCKDSWVRFLQTLAKFRNRRT